MKFHANCMFAMYSIPTNSIIYKFVQFVIYYVCVWCCSRNNGFTHYYLAAIHTYVWNNKSLLSFMIDIRVYMNSFISAGHAFAQTNGKSEIYIFVGSINWPLSQTATVTSISNPFCVNWFSLIILYIHITSLLSLILVEAISTFLLCNVICIAFQYRWPECWCWLTNWGNLHEIETTLFRAHIILRR